MKSYNQIKGNYSRESCWLPMDRSFLRKKKYLKKSKRKAGVVSDEKMVVGCGGRDACTWLRRWRFCWARLLDEPGRLGQTACS